ncbi:putative ABC transporter substrate-binding protein [Gordonia rhizosphera NBRC 16068]|uniref:Putative ABC transporter substrate-binding protein n=1 Tax=Gordonia rhizosphera NBRC 16068 TaxID=1108045 RepID=K6VBT6_9ACTN|nr:putative ABC transporter substrate-binding protein [Gordonia rhizosphera NBRC 16068]
MSYRWAVIKRATTAILVVLTLVATVTGCSETDTTDDALVVGSSGTPAMEVMAQIYAGVLRHAGSRVSQNEPIGDDRALLDEMDAGTVDLFPSFGGRLVTELAPGLNPQTPSEVYDDLNRSLPQGVSVGDPTTVSVTPQVFVSTAVAERSGVNDLADCARLPAGLPVVVVGSPDETVMETFRAAGCRFGAVESVSSAADAVARVATGDAAAVLTPLDVSGAQKTGDEADLRALRVEAPEEDGSAATVVVTGPRPQELVPVYRTAALNSTEVKAVNTVAGEMSTAELATLVAEVNRGADPQEVAVNWLGEHGL